MRNAMICVSVMLAIFLGWPLAFGGGGNEGIETQVGEARAIAAPAPPQLIQASAVTGPVDGTRPESCYHRYQREVKQCSEEAGAVCRLGAADHWDMCEATGFWPE